MGGVCWVAIALIIPALVLSYQLIVAAQGDGREPWRSVEYEAGAHRDVCTTQNPTKVGFDVG